VFPFPRFPFFRVEIVFNRLGIEAAENIVAIARAGQPLNRILERSYPQAVEGITSRLVNLVAQGINPRTVARQVVAEGLSEGLNHILLVARDQGNRNYREGSRQQYQRSGVVNGYRRLAAKQPGRTCLACIALDGTVYPTDEFMPLHPQDRCVMVPIVEGFKPITWTAGETYFKSLPREVQADWLGPARWDLWKTGQFEFRQLATIQPNDTWGPGAQVTSVANLLKGKGGGGIPEQKPSQASIAFHAFDNANEADKWGRAYAADWQKSLTASEKDSFEYYQSTGYRSVNAGLRYGDKLDKDDKDTIADLDKTLAKTSVDRNLITYRGFSSQEIIDNFDRLRGTIFPDKGFVSTSLDREIGDKFARWAREDEQIPIIAEIRVPKGSRGAYMGGLLKLSEAELLLPRDTKFRVIDTKIDSDEIGEIRRLVLEVINE
jgi:ADP-ribosyltransferase exoenzyme